MNRWFLDQGRSVLAGLLALMWSVTMVAQEAPSPVPGVFSEVLDVRVINIEVVVTDRNGIRVSGLAPEDFRLLVDGEEVSVDYFTEVQGGIALEGTGEGDESGARGLPALRHGEPVGTSYLVFVDEFFSLPNDRDRVLQSLADELGFLGPRDRMAVVAFNGKNLDMLSTWSQSSRELGRTLRDASRRPAYGLQRQAERRTIDFESFLRDSSALVGDQPIEGPGLDDLRLSPDQRFYATRLAGQVENLVRAASATLRSFAAPPGRKVFLVVSGGWPFLPTQFVEPNRLGHLQRTAYLPEGSDLYSPLSDTANLLGYTIYAGDASGLRFTGVDASVGGPPSNDLGGFATAQLREQEQRQSLRYLAERTGGKALLGASRRKLLSSAAQDTRSYYWIGFTPQRQEDNVRHSIRVEVKNSKFKVRSRRGLLDSSRAREVSMAVESTLLFGSGGGEERLVVQLGEPRRLGLRKMVVPLSLEIPAQEVTFVPVDGAYIADLEVRVAVIDELGGHADIPVLPVVYRGEQAPVEGSQLQYETQLEMRRREHRAVVAVYDKASGKILTGTVTITP